MPPKQPWNSLVQPWEGYQRHTEQGQNRVHLCVDTINPVEDLLVGQPMERPCKPIKAGREGEVGVRERTGDDM